MAKPSSGRQPPSTLLKPSNTLTEWKSTSQTQYIIPRMVNEFRLCGKPESLTLKDFVDLYLLDIGSYDYNQCIWVTKDSFVHLKNPSSINRGCIFPGAYRHPQFGLLAENLDQSSILFGIHAMTSEKALAGLDFLLELKDTHFQRVCLSQHVELTEEEFHPCRLEVHHLKKFLGNTERQNAFTCMDFAPDQSRELVSCEPVNNLGLDSCTFLDGGKSFMESATRRQKNSGLTEFSIRGFPPFDTANWVLFLNTLKDNDSRLSSVELTQIELDQEACNAVAEANIQNLELHGCGCEDQGIALIQSVMSGRGPRSLFFSDNAELSLGTLGQGPFEAAEMWITFTNALRSENSNLESLTISDVNLDDAVVRSLASALRENKRLIHLMVCLDVVSEECWNEFMGAISTHPSLRTIDLYFEEDNKEGIVSSNERNDGAKQRRTGAIADMLKVNRQVEKIVFHQNMYDQNEWCASVAPKLEHNLYRKRFLRISKIGELSTRAAVLAAAMARVRSNPSLLGTLLSYNHDILVSCIASASACDNGDISIDPSEAC
jgi:hypothetical protein